MDIWKFEKTLKKFDRADQALSEDFEKRFHDQVMGALGQDRVSQQIGRSLRRMPRLQGLVAGFVAAVSALVFGWIQSSKISSEERLALAMAKDPEAYRSSLMGLGSDQNAWTDTQSQEAIENLSEEEMQRLLKEIE